MINAAQHNSLEIDDMHTKEDAMMRPRLRMVVCTLTDVEAEEELSISYISLKGLSTHKRKENLAKSWFFDCTCRGCSDPYETDWYIATPSIFFPPPNKCNNSGLNQFSYLVIALC